MSDEKKDLTRIEDLSDLLHEVNSDLDDKLEHANKDNSSSVEIDQLEQSPSVEEGPLNDENFSDNEESNQLSDEISSESFDSDSFGSDSDSFSNLDSDFSEEETDPNFSMESTELDSADASFSDKESSFDSKESSFQEKPEAIDNTDPSFETELAPEINESSEEQDNFKPALPSIPEKNSFKTELDYEKQDKNSDNLTTTSTARENFKDIQNFGQNITHGKIKTGGNPPFSVLVRDIKYKEDSDDIAIILKEYSILNDENSTLINQSLSQGTLLIPQISEYAAIFLAHKLRRFHCDIQVGLSDEITPSKINGTNSRGLVSKRNLHQNIIKEFTLKSSVTESNKIIITSTPTLDGHNIENYLDIITESIIIQSAELKKDNLKEIDINDSKQEWTIPTNIYYKQITEKLKKQALLLKADAIVGINFTLTPVIDNFETHQVSQYKLTCTGNAVKTREIEKKENE